MTGDPVKPTRRSYDNSGRAEQARATRHRVLDATYRLLIDRGYSATTIKAVAAEAGVSPETVYKTFGTKARLIKDTYDATLAGDEAPVPMAERPEFRALIAEPTAEGKLAHYAEISRLLNQRLAPLLDVLLSGAKSGDRDLAEFAETIRRERTFGATQMAQVIQASLRPELDPDHARDLIWTLNSPEVYQLIVGERGWSADQYQAWLAHAFVAELLSPR